MRAELYAFLDGCQMKVKDDLRPVKPNAAMVAGVLDALRAAAHLDTTIEPPAWLDGVVGSPAHEIVACSNGLLHLPTLKLRPHTRSFSISTRSIMPMSATRRRRGNSLAFLNQVWPDDPESIATLQQLFGYLLTSDTSQQKSFLTIGPKRSGKGTIARVLARLIGPRNFAAPTLASLGERLDLRR